jgi:transposase
MLWRERRSLLKKELFYIERDEEKRQAFDAEIADLPSDTDIVYVDESGTNKHMSREYGRSPVGERVYLASHGRKYKKVNIVGGLLYNKVLCPTKYTWNTTSEWFSEWLEWYLCPLLREGSIIVMDNASFHKKSVLNRVAQSYVFRIIWLAPYSPDKNPIEKYWANMKNWLRLHAKKHATIQDALSAYFKSE